MCYKKEKIIYLIHLRKDWIHGYMTKIDKNWQELQNCKINYFAAHSSYTVALFLCLIPSQ